MELRSEAEQYVFQLDQALREQGKALDRRSTKALRSEMAAVSKLTLKIKPDKLNAEDVSALRAALAQLKQTACATMGGAGV